MGFSSGLVIAGLEIPHVPETNSRFYTVPINHYPIQLDEKTWMQLFPFSRLIRFYGSSVVSTFQPSRAFHCSAAVCKYRG